MTCDVRTSSVGELSALAAPLTVLSTSAATGFSAVRRVEAASTIRLRTPGETLSNSMGVIDTDAV